MMHTSSRSGAKDAGFTLIELLIVIGIIGFLAAAVLVAVDPVKRIQDARDARRFSEVNGLLNAILTKQVDGRQLYNGDSTAPINSSNTLAQVIVRDASAVTCTAPATAPICPQLPTGTTLDLSGAKTCVAQLKSLQVTAPGVLTTAAPTVGGNVTAGTHSYKVTFTTANGETDLGTVSATQTATAANGTIALSAIPVGAAGLGVTNRNIYRTAAGAAATGPWLFLTQVAGNVTTVFSDTLSDAALGASGPATNSTGGLIPNYLADLPLDPGTSVTVTGLPIGAGNTGYYINRNSAGRISIGACFGEQTTSISVQR